ncbi:MAG: isoprenyl transferase [Bryobacteraceae bacterium]
MQALLDALAPDDLEYRLAQGLDPNRIPRHIAIIMDGNGRWAGQRNLPRVAGHKAGVPSVRTAVETCARLGVEVLTLYAFSVENWKRPRAEVEMLWQLLRVYLRLEIATLMRNNVRLGAIGRLDALPPVAQRELERAIEKTSSNTGLHLSLAINYGGRAELVDAMKKLRDSGAEITEESVSECLYASGQPDPDLLIRTSGEMRVSNFLLWQIAYAELYVTEVLWPDFSRAELLRAILDYQKRDRRFGGLGAAAAALR